MITIHKFNISSAGTTEVELSSAADIIHCGVQQGIICIWALVDTDFEKEKRTFKVFGTGWDIGIRIGDEAGVITGNAGIGVGANKSG